jgi:hypothetical protein
LFKHYLNISQSNPIDIVTGQKIEHERLVQTKRVDQLMSVNNYFYRLDRAGVGKNHLAT